MADGKSPPQQACPLNLENWQARYSLLTGLQGPEFSSLFRGKKKKKARSLGIKVIALTLPPIPDKPPEMTKDFFDAT